MTEIEIRIHSQRLPRLRQRLVIAARLEQDVTVSRIDHQREWVQFLRPPNLGNRLFGVARAD